MVMAALHGTKRCAHFDARDRAIIRKYCGSNGWHGFVLVVLFRIGADCGSIRACSFVDRVRSLKIDCSRLGSRIVTAAGGGAFGATQMRIGCGVCATMGTMRHIIADSVPSHTLHQVLVRSGGLLPALSTSEIRVD